MHQISRILCAVDFSRPAHAAFEQALALSRARNAELTVVHAVPKDQPFRWHARERIGFICSDRRLPWTLNDAVEAVRRRLDAHFRETCERERR